MKELWIAKESTNPHHRLSLILSDQKKTYHDKHLIMNHFCLTMMKSLCWNYKTFISLFWNFPQARYKYESFQQRKVLDHQLLLKGIEITPWFTHPNTRCIWLSSFRWMQAELYKKMSWLFQGLWWSRFRVLLSWTWVWHLAEARDYGL